MPRKKKGDRKPATKGDFIHFRTTSDLTAALDAEAARLGTSRSGAGRVLLFQALGKDAREARAREAVYDMSGPIKRATEKVLAAAVRALPEAIAAEFDAAGLDGSVAGLLDR